MAKSRDSTKQGINAECGEHLLLCSLVAVLPWSYTQVKGVTPLKYGLGQNAGADLGRVDGVLR